MLLNVFRIAVLVLLIVPTLYGLGQGDGGAVPGGGPFAHAMPSGSSLTVRKAGTATGKEFQLLYTQQGKPQKIIWRRPVNWNFDGFATILDAYETEGLVTTLLMDGPGDVVLVRAQTSSDSNKPRVLRFSQLEHRKLTETLRLAHLVDHEHIEVGGEGGEVEHVEVDFKTYEAKLDGKPIDLVLLFPEAKFYASSLRAGHADIDGIFDGKVKVNIATPQPKILDIDFPKTSIPDPLPPLPPSNGNQGLPPAKNRVQENESTERRPSWLYVGFGLVLLGVTALLFLALRFKRSE